MKDSFVIVNEIGCMVVSIEVKDCKNVIIVFRTVFVGCWLLFYPSS